MLDLRKVFENKRIQKEITGDLGSYLDNMKEIFNDIKLNNEIYSFNRIINGCDFQSCLHKDKDKDLYLLEARLFSRKDGQMLNSYLRCFDGNLNIVEGIIDDVWEYADWEECV